MKRHQLFSAIGNIFYPRSYYGMLGALLFTALIAPLTLHHLWGHVLLSVAMSIILLLGSVTISQNHRTGSLAFLVALVACIVWSTSSFFTGRTETAIALDFMSNIIAIGFLGITASAILRDVFNNEVSGNRICGAIVVYLLGGLCVTMINLNILLFDPHAFTISDALKSQGGSLDIGTTNRFSLLLYFSFCTLTTVGYGDISPVNPVARNVAWLEAVAGQLYLTILVARLVGLHIMKTPANRSEDFEEQISRN